MWQEIENRKWKKTESVGGGRGLKAEGKGLKAEGRGLKEEGEKESRILSGVMNEALI